MHRLHLPHLDFSANLNTEIFIVFVAVLVIGLFLGEARLKKIALATFAGIVIATSLAPLLSSWLTHFHRHYASVEMIKLVLLGLAIVLLSLGRLHHSERRMKLSMRLVILSLITAGLVVSNVITFLPSELARKLLAQSNLVVLLNSTRLWWIGLAAIWLMVVNFWPSQKLRK